MTSVLARLIAVLSALCLLVACGGQDDSSGDGQTDGKIPDTPVITAEPAIARSEIADGANTDAISVAETMAAEEEAEIGRMKKLLEGLP